MAETNEYKCPNCGAGIVFDSSAQKMKCPYCDSEFDVDALAKYDEELKTDSQSDMQWQDKTEDEWNDTDGMSVYVCKSCGGEIVGDETVGATSCPYCGNPVVIMNAFRGALKPDYIIPFELDKETAKKKLVEHYKGKHFLPKVFTEQNHIDEIKALYVPFWIYDATADARFRFKTTTVRSWTKGNYRYTETKHYMVNREGTLKFSKVPVDGSSKMPNDLMESIEPYDFSKAVDFQTAYLSGYLADKYDEDLDKCTPIANSRIDKSTEAEFRSTVSGYSSVTVEAKNINLVDSVAKYAMYPVWILNTSFDGKNYLFAMNGQTGKFVGDLPVDKKKMWGTFALILLIATVVLYLIISMFVLNGEVL